MNDMIKQTVPINHALRFDRFSFWPYHGMCRLVFRQKLHQSKNQESETQAGTAVGCADWSA